jgi:hypothetical protein
LADIGDVAVGGELEIELELQAATANGETSRRPDARRKIVS